jgi:hypothetical protein
MNNDEIIGNLIRARDFSQIDAFVETVRSDPEAIAHFTRHGTKPEVAVAWANQHGYDFDLPALEAWIERSTAALAAARQERHAGWLARRADSAGVEPQDVARDTRAVLHDLAWSTGFELDRKAVLSGDVVVIRQCTPILGLRDLITGHLGAMFETDNLAQVFETRDDVTMQRCSAAAYRGFLEDKHVPEIMHAVHVALGCLPEESLWEWPGFRLIPALPRELGIYRDHHTGSVGSHRDTWYGSPHHQINCWTPLWPMARGAGVVVQTHWYQHPVDNTSAGYDQWLNALGLTLPPVPRIETAGPGELSPHVEPGDLLIFAGQHLHRSGCNSGPGARGSLEWRLLVEPDRRQPWCPVNVDFRGRGEIAENWFDHNGTPAMPAAT